MAWTELNGRRTQKAKHYYDSTTGKYQAVFSIHDQHYKDEFNQWQDIDESFITDGADGFSRKNDKTRHVFRIGTGGNERWYPRRNVTTEYVDITEIQYYTNRWRTLNLPAAVWKQQGAEWDMPDLYASITNTWRSIKSDFILKNSNAYTRLRFAVSFVGLTYNHTTGELTSTTDGLVWGYIQKPNAYYIDGENEIDVPITNLYDGSYIEWSVDTTGATYPIYIDPTFYDGQGNVTHTDYDTYVEETNADTNYGTANSLRIRAVGGTGRYPLIKFTLSSLVGTTITSADLDFYNVAFRANVTVNVHRILVANSSWTEAGATWNHTDGANHWAGDVGSNGGSDAGCSVSGTDYSSTSMGSFASLSTDIDGTNYPVSCDLDEFDLMVSSNNGIVLVSGSSALNTSVASSDHATEGYRPLLTVVYEEGVPPTTITTTVTVVDWCVP